MSILDLIRRSLKALCHSLDLLGRSLDLISHSLDLISRLLKILCRSLDLISRSLKILCCSLDLISRSLKLISRSLKIVCSSLDLISRSRENIISRERDIKLREQLKNKMCMSLPGFRRKKCKSKIEIYDWILLMGWLSELLPILKYMPSYPIIVGDECILVIFIVATRGLYNLPVQIMVMGTKSDFSTTCSHFALSGR